MICWRTNRYARTYSNEVGSPVFHTYSLYDTVEALQEAGAVLSGEGRRATFDDSVRAKLRQKVTGGEGVADRGFTESTPLETQRPGALAQATRSEGDIAGDDDVVPGDVLDDPIIRGVELVAHDHQLEPVLVRDLHSRVRYQSYLELIAPGYTVDLLLDRAAIGVDHYFRQVLTLSVT